VFVVEGPRAIGAAFEAGAALEALYTAPDAATRCADLLEESVRRGVQIVPLAPGVIERVSDAVTPQPVLAVARIPARDLADADVSLVVVLADVREPGNAGTIVRSAEGAGATAVVFCHGSADAYAPKVVRATAGALFHVPVFEAGSAREVVDVLREKEVRVLGTVADGGEAYHAFDWTAPTAIVLGNEAWGLPADVADAVDSWVSIPLAGRTESLNVAMAASVLLFEARRQRAATRP
jgi:TrmH family RNA methyltransferase